MARDALLSPREVREQRVRVAGSLRAAVEGRVGSRRARALEGWRDAVWPGVAASLQLALALGRRPPALAVVAAVKVVPGAVVFPDADGVVEDVRLPAAVLVAPVAGDAAPVPAFLFLVIFHPENLNEGARLGRALPD